MRTVSVPRTRLAAPRSKRLLALAGDDRLVEHIRGGDELAFEVAFERHSPAILSFCRHMLGSREEAEDAVQQAFASAIRDLQRDDREINLKPWLFTIARNRCLSMLRARRERAVEPPDIPTAGLAEQVESRGELRDLLQDLDDLPHEQRAALLMSELSGLSHAEIGGVLDCEPAKVKALVFRARSGLIERRDARETPCLEIREQLANLRGGSLRRSGLRQHLRVCEGCREYREEIKRQRSMLAAVLPVAPSLGLKETVLAAMGIGGGGGAAGGGAIAGGGALVAKVATVCVLAGGAGVAGERAIDAGSSGAGRAADPPAAVEVAAPAQTQANEFAATKGAGGRSVARGAPGKRVAKGRERARARHERKAARERSQRAPGLGKRKSQRPVVPPGQAKKETGAQPGNRGRSEEAHARNEQRTAEKPKPLKPETPAKPEKTARSVAPPTALDQLVKEERKAAKGE